MMSRERLEMTASFEHFSDKNERLNRTSETLRNYLQLKNCCSHDKSWVVFAYQVNHINGKKKKCFQYRKYFRVLYIHFFCHPRRKKNEKLFIKFYINSMKLCVWWLVDFDLHFFFASASDSLTKIKINNNNILLDWVRLRSDNVQSNT